MIHSKLSNSIYQIIARFKNLDPSLAINVFADPRSGSTWLVEVLNHLPKSIILDEPLHLKHIKSFKSLNFCWRQHIPEKESWPKVFDIFNDQIYRGKKLNYRLCHKNTIAKTIQCDHIIYKFIRGKAMLPWLISNFQFQYAPIVLIRHPLGMVASMRKHSGWTYEFQKFKLLDCPFPEIYNQHIDFLSSLKTKEEQLISYWCICNNLILQHKANNSKWISINYESLISDPQTVITEVFKRWDLDIPPKIFSELRVASGTTIDDTQLSNPNNQISKWLSEFSKKEIKSYQVILDYFKVDYYSTGDPMPQVFAANTHL